MVFKRRINKKLMLILTQSCSLYFWVEKVFFYIILLYRKISLNFYLYIRLLHFQQNMKYKSNQAVFISVSFCRFKNIYFLYPHYRFQLFIFIRRVFPRRDEHKLYYRSVEAHIFVSWYGIAGTEREQECPEQVARRPGVIHPIAFAKYTFVSLSG